MTSEDESPNEIFGISRSFMRTLNPTPNKNVIVGLDSKSKTLIKKLTWSDILLIYVPYWYGGERDIQYCYYQENHYKYKNGSYYIWEMDWRLVTDRHRVAINHAEPFYAHYLLYLKGGSNKSTRTPWSSKNQKEADSNSNKAYFKVYYMAKYTNQTVENIRNKKITGLVNGKTLPTETQLQEASSSASMNDYNTCESSADVTALSKSSSNYLQNKALSPNPAQSVSPFSSDDYYNYMWGTSAICYSNPQFQQSNSQPARKNKKKIFDLFE